MYRYLKIQGAQHMDIPYTMLVNQVNNIILKKIKKKNCTLNSRIHWLKLNYLSCNEALAKPLWLLQQKKETSCLVYSPVNTKLAKHRWSFLARELELRRNLPYLQCICSKVTEYHEILMASTLLTSPVYGRFNFNILATKKSALVGAYLRGRQDVEKSTQTNKCTSHRGREGHRSYTCVWDCLVHYLRWNHYSTAHFNLHHLAKKQQQALQLLFYHHHIH